MRKGVMSNLDKIGRLAPTFDYEVAESVSSGAEVKALSMRDLWRTRMSHSVE